MVDTGASLSALGKSLVERIGARRLGKVSIQTIQGEQFQDLYSISLTVGRLPPAVVPVIAIDDSPYCEMLIGRDMLARFRIKYNPGHGYLTVKRVGLTPALNWNAKKAPAA